ALNHYQHLVHLLRAELDAAPAAEISALAASLEQPASRPAIHRPSSGLPAHNLPHQFTPFVGREDLLALVHKRLCQDACRLLTLAGPGGVGKTRLAVEAARRQASAFASGVHFIDLAPLDDPNQLPAAVAASLELVLPPQARTLQEQQDALIHLLANRQALLILDNYEHLLPDVALVTRLLQETSRLHLLVTSRAPLNLRAEWIVDVDGLPVPPPDADTEALTGECFPALALFEQAAGRVKHDFSPSAQERLVAAHICRLVQGAPLALELAAARVRELPLEQIAAAIEQDLDFLSTAMADVPERHRSLRAVFDHSWQLLPPQQQAVFARLAVFRDPFTPEAAWQVAGASEDQLAELSLHALLRPLESGRFGLHPSLRQFAAEKLAAGPNTQAEIHRRHGAYYLAQLQQQGERLFSRDALPALAQLRQDVNNLRAAWNWAVASGELRSLVRAADGAYRFFNALGLVQEGRRAMTSALALVEEAPEESDARLFRARLLAKLARFLNLQGLYDQADAAAGEAVALLSAEPAAENLALAAAIGAEAWLQWGRAALHQGRYEESEGRLEEAQGLARLAGAPSLEAEIHLNLGTIYNFQNAFDAANAHDEAALELARACGDLYTEGLALNNMGSVADFRGDYDAAAKCFEEAMTVFDAVGYRRGSAAALSNLGAAESWRGKLDKALVCHQEALQAATEMGDIDGEAWALMALGAVHTHLGRLDEARTDLEAALALNGQDGTRT
ncbi:MAG: tetratricopeptide repeat protein, partial [Caldilineae bacterium]